MHDQDGFREFVVARGRALSRSAYLLTGDHHLAEELLQTALTRSVTHWRRIAGGDPEAYIRRTMINERTSRWRRRRYEVAANQILTGYGSVVPDPADRVVREVTVIAALAHLPARQRAVVVLRFFDDMTEAAAAQVLGCSVGTVKSQTHAALKRLRALAPALLTDSPATTGATADTAREADRPSSFSRPEVTS
jgi:RNA polymerase sigma-70 factor (sigma-E family)